MKKNLILLIVSCAIMSILIVWVLFMLSQDFVHQNNNFVRLFPPHPVVLMKSIDISESSLGKSIDSMEIDSKNNYYYIAGITSNRIYVGNSGAPLHLLSTDLSLTKTDHIRILTYNFDNRRFRSIRVAVDSPLFYVMDGAAPAILRGSTRNWKASRYMYDSAYFSECVPLNGASFALRSVSSQSNENVLAKETLEKPHIKFASNILEKQVDGLFCTDGILHYSADMNRLIYIYYYRNQFICMDTSLNVIYKGKTIDTVSQVKIKVAKISSDKAITLAAPPYTVNKQSCVSGDKLFVNSTMLAKNEVKASFDQGSVIDVYDLKNGGSYEFSFYLYDHNSQKLQSFKVKNGVLAAIYGRHVVMYKMVDRYFKK
jgi:hypothetical protein